MDVDWNGEVVAQLESHWRDQLRPRLSGLTDDEYFAGNDEAALHQLDDAHETWIEGVRRLGTAGLARPQGATQPPEFADAPMARLILYMNLEVIHHGAEICLLRDLYLRNSREV